jgi:amidophosphoribosyltransferase
VCGVFGIYGHPDAATLTYFALIALQHRGQEAAGITTIDDGKMHVHRDLGLVTDVFSKGELAGLTGNTAIGHVRYSTAGGNTVQNAQPITVSTHSGHLAIAHNGNLVNAKKLRIELEEQGSIFQTTSDTEVIAHLIARYRQDSMTKAIEHVTERIIGGYALVILTNNELFALRDPNGLRPLAIGKLDDSYVVASESCAFETIGATFIRNVEPGEIIRINERGIQSVHYAKSAKRRICTFEYIYFARPDSDIDGWNVHAVRKRLGQIMATTHPASGDIVIGVPDSSISAAAGFAEESKIPNEMGLVKNKYIARTFIQPTQTLRDAGVRMKLNAVRSVVAGKRVILIDDSIVRGTTSKRIVQMLRNAGATEVHVRISSPPYRFPCHYGIDTSSQGELIAAHKTVSEICAAIGADSLEFLSIPEMMQAFHLPEDKGEYPFCNCCFTGDYPTPLPDLELETSRIATASK